MLKITITGVFVQDQERASKFYTEKLGFVKKTRHTRRPVQVAHGSLARRSGRNRTTA